MRRTDIEARARELHRRAIIIDAHSDILIPIADNKMRLGDRVQVPDPATWQPPVGLSQTLGVQFGFTAHTFFYGPMGQYDIPRLQEGGVTAQACAIYIEDCQLDYALHQGLVMTWYLHQTAAENDQFELITTAADIRRIKAEGKCGGILTFEGCEALGSDLRMLDLYHKLGLRMASLTHSRRNLYADGAMFAVRTGGLTGQGREAIRRMNQLRIVVDLVHISEESFWDVLSITTAPVVLSHSTGTMFPWQGPDGAPPSALHPGFVLPRDRAMLEAIARNGGVIGIIFFAIPDLDEVVANIELAIEVMGPDHVGLGSDFYGLDYAPRELPDMSQLPRLTQRLVARGHSDEVILKILGGNLLRVFEQVWGA
jgi:membrane dipeptidase